MIKETFNPYKPIYISPPGDTLLETLEERNLPIADFAERMNEPLKAIQEIIVGEALITPELALKLEQVLNIPATFWNNRERNYRESLARPSVSQYTNLSTPLKQ